MSLILNQQTPSSVPTPSSGKTTVFVNTSDQLVTKDSTGNVSVFPTVSAAGNTGIFYNDQGALSTSANLSFNNTTNTVTVLGNVAATGVVTNNLYYSNGNPWDLEQPAGSNTQVQFNNNSSFGASSSFTFDTATSTLTTANLSVTGNAVITGDLAVNGNVTYINVETLAIEDPLISVGGGPNGNALTSDDGKDRGTLLQYYTSTPVTGFMGWDNSNGEFAFGSNVSVSSDVVTFNTLGKTRAGGLFVGANAIQSDFPNAKVIVSQNDSGQTHSENIGIVGEAVADSGNTSTWGIGVLGEARANGATKATGVQGGAYVTNTSDSGAAVGVRGYATQTHAGGYNIGVLGNAAGSGLGNYAFYVQSGNIASIETDNLVRDLADDSNSALMFNSSGKANIFGIETTDGAEGIYTQGYLNVSGNASVGGVKTDNLYYANGTPWDFQQAAGSNTYIQYNANGDFGASSNFTFDQTTDQLTVGGNVVSGNANLGNVATANFFTGTLTTASQPNITTVGTLTNLEVSGNIVASGNITANLNISAVGNVGANNITVISSLGANTGNFFNVNVGNLASIDKLGTANGVVVGTTVTANGNIRSNANIISNGGLFVLGTANLNNLNISGNIGTDLIPNANITYNLGNNTNRWNNAYLGTSLYIGTSNITANGSNLDIGASHVINVGNIEANNALIEGRIFVGGSEAATGFTNPVILAEAGAAPYVQVGLINTDANGSADFTAYGDNGNDIAGWMDMGFTGSDFSDANFTITKQNDGYIFVQPVNGVGLGGNLVIATGDQGANRDIVFATGGFLAVDEKMRLRDVQAQLDIQMTTPATTTTTGALVVAGGVGVAVNLYVGGTIYANISGNLVAPGSNTQILFNDGGTVSADSGLIYNKTTDALTATGTVTAGNLSTAGTLSVTGNANVGNIGAAAGVFTTVEGPLTTAAQPNITSVGTLTALTVTGNVTGGNLNTSGNVNSSIIVNGGTGIYLAPGPSGYINFFTTGGDKASVSDTGNIIASNLIANSTVFAVTANISGNVNAGNVYANSGTIGASLLTGTLTTAAQPNVTSLGTLSSVTASGNIQTSANIVTDLIVGRTSGVTITATGANQSINLTPTGTGTVNVGTFRISNVATPTQTTDAATKQYVDTLAASGIHYHEAVFVESPDSAGNLNVTYNNGTSGVGATLTNAGTQVALTIDGVLMTIGKRVLIYNQTNQFENGVYTVTTVGTASTNWVLTRATDADTYDPFSPTSLGQGDAFFVTNGNTGAGETYICNTVGTITFGTTAITFAQISDSTLYTAGTGLSLTGTEFSISNTAVTTGTYGGADVVSTIAVNQQGQITSASNTVIQANAANLSGTTLKSTVVNSSLTSVGTLSTLTVSGNANVGNIGATNGVFTNVSGNGSALTSITGANVTGAVSFATTANAVAGANVSGEVSFAATANSVAGANVSGQVGNALVAGTVYTASQSNITSVGTLISLTVSGNISAGNVNAPTFGAHVGSVNGTVGATTANTGAFTTVSATGQITSTVSGGTAPFVVTSTTQVANLNVATAGLAGYVTAAAQSNITSVGTLSGLTVTSTITGNITGSASTAGTVTTAAQPNITSTGTLTSLSVTGNVSAGNVSATAGTFTNVSGNGSSLTALNASNISSGTLAQARLANASVTLGSTALTLGSTVTTVAGLSSVTSTTFVGALSGAATTAGTVTTAAQPNITSVGTLTGLTLSGTLSGAVQIGTGTATHFGTTLTTGANTTAGSVIGNWTLSAGSRWNASYADLSEKYVADANYGPGTVLIFGGEHEVTIATEMNTTRVAGVITTDAAYTMNSGLEAEFIADIALQGRVPCKVIGPVFKGDLLVAASNGHAIANNEARAGTIIGKSLENFNEASGIIEVAVGRF